MIEKNASTRFSHDPEVGVKCSWTRGCRSSRARGRVLVGGQVVDHHVQPAARIDGGDLVEGQELLVAMPLGAGVGHPAGGHIEGGEQRGCGTIKPRRAPADAVEAIAGPAVKSPGSGRGRCRHTARLSGRVTTEGAA
jgi:hypothetical protein